MNRAAGQPGAGDQPRALLVLVVGDREVPLGPVGSAAPCDLGLVEDIARFGLAALRFGWSIRLREVDAELGALVDLVGLADHLGIRTPPQRRRNADEPTQR